jgi:hypothetical protein
MEKRGEIGIVPLMAGMALFVVLGTPLVGFLWHSLNRLLSGTIEAWRLAATVPVLLLLWGLLHLLARRVWRWEGHEVS